MTTRSTRTTALLSALAATAESPLKKLLLTKTEHTHLKARLQNSQPAKSREQLSIPAAHIRTVQRTIPKSSRLQNTAQRQPALLRQILFAKRTAHLSTVQSLSSAQSAERRSETPLLFRLLTSTPLSRLKERPAAQRVRLRNAAQSADTRRLPNLK